MKDPDQRFTIKDIARMAGVSIGTVDRVLHNRGRVRPETEARIKEAIERTGYTPAFFASRLSKSRSVTFGVIMPLPEQDSGYWELCRQGIEKTRQDLSSYNVRVRYFFFDRYSPEHVGSVIDEASGSGCDGFVVAPIVQEPFREAVESGRLGKNITFFDTELTGVEVRCTVGQDSFASGLLSAKLISLLMYAHSDSTDFTCDSVLVIDLSENDFHLQQRVAGFMEYFKSRHTGSPRVIQCADTDSPQEVHNRMQKAFEGFSAVRGVFVPNATTHLYAAACRQLGHESVKIVGYDCVPANTEGVISGDIDFLISQRPEEQASEALANLYRFSALQTAVPARVMVPIDIITRENAR